MMPQTMDLNEAQTRAAEINPQLERADWNLADHTQVRFEVPVTGYDPTPWNGFTDYCLYDADGSVIAVIEAKKTARNPREGEEQLRQYVDEITRKQGVAPFGFMTNGLHHYFWEVGLAHPRMVAGFFTPDDLRRLRFIRNNRKPLGSAPINNAIVERSYQLEAIRRVAEAFEAGRRRTLLVMATGTGKTRTTMGLIDIALQTSSAQKVLFLADRDALVEQALNDGFKAHLPNEPRVRIRTANIDRNKRLYVATLQTMGVCYQQFSPAFFDLIVFDEAHRSIFNRFTEVIEYFDARMVGLTATPAAFIDRDTFRVFDCRDQTPTFLYTYEQAIKDGHLVDFDVYQAQTGFQRDGIKGATLSEEDRNALIEQGLDPDAIDYAGTDLEVLVTNKDTIRRQWEEIINVCIKDSTGSTPGKTIVFAMTKEHANRVREVFEELFPQYVGMLQVVFTGIERVHDGPYGDGLISKFKKEDKPRIAVSVDMLDTGIDVPEVVNLVFLKPVHSRIKLWQMVGRGTRNQQACRYFDRLPDGKKTRFLIIDFWQNDFGRQVETTVPLDMPLLTRLFNTRLDILALTLNNRDNPAYAQAISDCRAMLARVPLDSFMVRKVWRDLENAWTDDFWSRLSTQAIEFLRLKVAPLLRFVPDVDVAAETFTNKVERLALAMLKGQPSAEQLASIADDVARLPQATRERSSKKASAELALSTALAQATRAQLAELIRELAPEMKNKRRSDNPFLAIDLPDFIAAGSHIIITSTGKPIHVEEYRKRIEARILKIAEDHPALKAVQEGRQPSQQDLIDLERVLHNELKSPDIDFTDKTARAVYGLKWDNRVGFLGLIRHVLELDAVPDYEAVVSKAFDTHIASQPYSADQIRFLRAVHDMFLSTGRLSEDDLREAPQLRTFGRNAVDRLLSPVQVNSLVHLTEELAV
jgi:type I restriction enzyme R subunit